MRMQLACFSLAAALMTALVVADGDAQPPGKKGGKKGGFGASPITADEIVDRIMSFDKNGDGKITLDELPERMQHLIALGDTNKDGALDRDEIRKLATTLEAFVGLAGGGGGGPPDGKKGDGPKGFKGGPKGAGGEALRALDDLNITGKTRDRADRLVKGYQDKLKKFDELSRAELVLQMKDVLSPEDHRAFKDAVDRPPGPPFGGPKKGPPDLERRIDQLQQELDDLRKKLSK